MRASWSSKLAPPLLRRHSRLFKAHELKNSCDRCEEIEASPQALANRAFGYGDAPFEKSPRDLTWVSMIVNDFSSSPRVRAGEQSGVQLKVCLTTRLSTGRYIVTTLSSDATTERVSSA